MTTRYFKWTDAGAPTLAGVVGSYIALMKALLVGGVGGVAYGSGGGQKLAAGWTVAWENSGANKIVLRNDSVGGSGCYMRILDDGSGAGGAREALVQIYESMTDIDTGTNPATSANSNAGLWVRKSDALSGAGRAWVFLADARTFYGGIYVTSATPPASGSGGWAGLNAAMPAGGDFTPAIVGDPGIFISARPLANSGAASVATDLALPATAAYAGAGTGFSTSRTASLVATPTPVGIMQMANSLSGTGFGGTGYLAALPAGDAHVHPAQIVGAAALRGRMRGLFVPLTSIDGVVPLGAELHPVGVTSPQGLAVLSGAASGSNNATVTTRVLVDTGDWGA